MENNNVIPLGFRFRPTDEELIQHYLLRKVIGVPLPSQVVKDCDLYGDKEPWEIWHEFSADLSEYVTDNGVDRKENCLYLFTKQKKKNKSTKRCDRLVGTGTWHGETGIQAIGICGSKKTFTYETNLQPKNNEFHWRMHEFSLNPNGFSPRLPEIDNNDIVLCRIIRDTKKRKAEEESPKLEGSLSNKHPRLLENGPPHILPQKSPENIQPVNQPFILPEKHPENVQPVNQPLMMSEKQPENYQPVNQPAVQQQCFLAIGNQSVMDPIEQQFYDDLNLDGSFLEQLAFDPSMTGFPTLLDESSGVYLGDIFSEFDNFNWAPAGSVSQFHQQPQPHQRPQPQQLTPAGLASQFHHQPQPQQPQQTVLQMEPQMWMLDAPSPSDSWNVFSRDSSDINQALQTPIVGIQQPTDHGGQQNHQQRWPQQMVPAHHQR